MRRITTRPQRGHQAGRGFLDAYVATLGKSAGIEHMGAANALLTRALVDVPGNDDGRLILLDQRTHARATDVDAGRQSVHHLAFGRRVNHENDLRKPARPFKHIVGPLADLRLVDFGRGTKGRGRGITHGGQADAIAKVPHLGMNVYPLFGEHTIHGRGIHVADLGQDARVQRRHGGHDASRALARTDVGQIPGQKDSRGEAHFVDPLHSLNVFMDIPKNDPKAVCHLLPVPSLSNCSVFTAW